MLVISSFAFTIKGQLADDWVLRFENLTVEDRLPSLRVLCVCQDRRGFMWFGTEEGLCRYDGFNFVEYVADINNSFSLSNNAVRAISEDDFGNLWIGTDGGGLNYFIPEKEVFYRVPLPIDSTCAPFENPDKIYTLLKGSNRRYWVGSYGHGLYLLPLFESVKSVIEFCENQAGDGVIHFLPDGRENGLNDYHIYCLFEDRFKHIWIGTDDKGSDFGGALHRVEEIDQFSITITCKLYRSDPDDEVSLGSNYIMSVFEDSRDRLWVSNWKGGLNLYHPERDHFERFQTDASDPNSINSNNIYELTEDNFGNIWVATYGGGISRIKEGIDGTKSFVPYQHDENANNSLVGDYVRQVFTDHSGLLWVITWKSGISRLRINRNPFIHIPLPGHTVSDTITEVVEFITCSDQGSVWLKTDANKSYTLSFGENRNQWQFRPTALDQMPVKLNLNRTTIGAAYPNDTALANMSQNARVIFEDSKNQLWFGVDTRLVHMFLDLDHELRIEEFKNNSLNPATLKGFQVTGIAEDLSGRIWISTLDALNLYDQITGKFSYLTMKNGLPGNAISGLMADQDGFLWLTTENGLARIDPESQICISYKENDGLPFIEFASRSGFALFDFQNFPAYCQLKNGSLLFSSMNRGLLLFNPSEIFKNQIPPRVWLTGIEILNQEVRTGDLMEDRPILASDISYTSAIYLKHQDRSFSLSFAALDFFLPGKTRYAYRLKPLEDDWIFTGAENRQVTYSHLPPGKYEFEIQGANADGVWNTSEQALSVFIAPEWYQTSWFQASSFAFLVTLLTLAYLLIRQRSRIYNELQFERLQREEIDKFTQIRMRFYTNVTHEFRTPLSLILGPLNKLISTSEESKLALELGVIQRNANRLLNLVNQLMDFRKIETKAVHLQVEKGNISRYVLGLTDLFQENAHSRGIKFEVSSNPEDIIGFFDPGAYDKIVFNLLSNAFKFTGKGKTISVCLREES